MKPTITIFLNPHTTFAEFDVNRNKIANNIPADVNTIWLIEEIQKYSEEQILAVRKTMFIQREVNEMNQFDLETLLAKLRFRFGSKN